MSPEERLIDDVKVGRTKSVQQIVQLGVDVNCLDDKGWTPLMWAAQEGHTAIVRFLLSAGADVHFADENGFTPLKQAISEQHLAAAEAIILAGADVNHQCWSDGNCTALHTAAAFGLVDGIELLLRYGADVATVNEDGKTAFELAVDCDEKEAAALLSRTEE